MKDGFLTLMSSCLSGLDRRAQLLVLLLHRVGLTTRITATHVRQHLQFMAAHYQIVTPSQWPTFKHARRVAMITIDDCHNDVYREVFPVAHELGLPITICVPTDFFLRNRWLWFDRFKWILSQAQRNQRVQIEEMPLIVGDTASHSALLQYLKQQTPHIRDTLIERLRVELGVIVPKCPVPGFQPVSHTDMRAMLASGLVELAAHTVSHPIMTRLSEQQLEQELVHSKQELEEFTGRKVAAFCYPNGEYGDFDELTRQAVAAAGYSYAFTSVEGLNYVGKMNSLALRRVHAHQRISVFHKHASGLGDLQKLLLLGNGHQTEAARTPPPQRMRHEVST